MSEEKETKCICQNETVRKVFVIALGTFIGVYAALSLFAATHRPPMMRPCPMGFGAPAPMAAPCPFQRHHHFDKKFAGDKKEFHKVINGPEGPAPFYPKKNHDKD